MGRGGDGLKQEMTSIPSATQLTAMIKKRERGDRQQQEIKFFSDIPSPVYLIQDIFMCM